MVISATAQIKRVLQSRHRQESVYDVANLTALLFMADRIATGLTWVLLLVAMVTLIVSGIGIMNIMLATVTSRMHGRSESAKAIGATNREIRFPVSCGGDSDLLDWRIRRNFHRICHPLFGSLPHRISNSD